MKKAASIMLLVLLAATLLSACSSSNNAAVGGGSTAVISANGGVGSTGYGGSGGWLGVYVYDTTNIKVTRSGSVNTAVDFSIMEAAVSAHTFTFGGVPMVVTSNTTLATYASGSEPATSTFHMHEGSVYIYQDNGSGDETVTGLHVNAGATLTLGLNISSFGDTGLDRVSIWLSDDFQNDGTITVLDLATGATPLASAGTYTADGRSIDKGGLYIYANGFSLNNGTITTKATDTTGATLGGYGGVIELDSYNVTVNKGTINASGGAATNDAGWGGYGGSYIHLYSNGGAINSGSMIASGGDGGYGGYAGRVYMYGDYGSINSGPITATGGTGNTYGGGGGGWFEMGSYYYLSPVFNSGTILVSGGSGSASGGYAGAAGFYSTAYQDLDPAGGDIVNTGSIIANGGNATSSGNGGYGADCIEFHTYGANIRNTGNIEMKGGNGKGYGYIGGGGGCINVGTDSGWEPANSDPVTAGSVQWSGNILADGGSGENGGSGGSINFQNDSWWGAPYSGTFELISYSNINLKGGKGYTNGGSAGYAELWWDYSNDSYVATYTPGTIYNDVDFDISGGEGETTSGGYGGYFIAQNNYDWVNTYWQNYKPGAKTDASSSTVGIENYGNITTKGGQGKLNGRDSGYFYQYGFNGTGSQAAILMVSDRSIINTGSLNASGGIATTTADFSGYGGYGEPVWIYAIGNMSNTGSIVTSGGNGNYSAGNAGSVYLFSDYGLNHNTGAITANGGNANTVDGFAGSGNDVEIYTNNGPIEATSSTTALVSAGTGSTPGSNGTFTVGWAP